MAEGDYDLREITKRIVMRIITLVEPYFTVVTKQTYENEFDPTTIESMSLFKS